MKVLQVNGYESPGRRFNGLSIAKKLEEHGVESRHLVWMKDSQNPDVLTFEGYWTKKTNLLLERIERIASLQSALYINASQLLKMKAFREADLIHLHIIHSGYLRISDLVRISAQKPIVWTLHDPWAMTGHCVYPINCTRWKTGCGNCPDLRLPFPLLRDTTRLLFDYKREAYRKSKFELIVASNWMRDMVETSPMFVGIKPHVIPFGLDLDFFSPTASPNARKRFGIPSDSIVILFRATDSIFKGFCFIEQALELISATKPICLLTLNSRGLLTRFSNRFKIIEIGWTDDEEIIRDAYIASDIFLMPSIAEAFGVMAIEALACGKPVIVFDGTSLPEVSFAPDIGIAVPQGDVDALHRAIQQLIDSPNERQERGRKGRVIAEAYYSDDAQVKQLARLYRSTIK